MFDEILKNLSKEWRDAYNDVQTFVLWSDRKINTYTCLKRFRRHNRIDSNVYIDVEIFELWLNSIGWCRDGLQGVHCESN